MGILGQVRVGGFDWDGANLETCRKHGVPIEQIEELFLDGVRVAPDIAHSIIEQRFIATGRTRRGRPVFVVFAIRERDGEALIRLISARDMHAKEAQRYAEAEGSGPDER